MSEKIVSAAVFKGVIVSLPAPARHHTILQSLDFLNVNALEFHNQGFLTDTGRYVNRVEAFGIAWKAGQIISDSKGPDLYSEDLW